MASEGTSTSSDKDRMEATQSAVNILAQGKRNMVCGEIPTAVNQFQEACQILSKAYGETAKECAEAYFCYGQALLDLARLENGVLGNALQGVPDTDDETTEQKDEQFEKAELEEKERDKIRQDVYDAMSEKESEKAEREKKAKDKKESGETMEVAMDTEESDKKPEDAKKEEGSDKKDTEIASEKEKQDDKVVKDEKDSVEKKEEAKLDEKDAKDKTEAKADKEGDNDKKDKTEAKADKGDDDKKDKTEAKADKGDDDKKDVKADEKEAKDDKKTKKEESEKESTEDGEEEEEEGTEGEEGTEEEGTEGEEGAEGEEGKAAEEGEDSTSQTGSQDGENPDDISNLQLAWEMLELAKLIYKKDDSKEAKLRVAEAHLKLGEVSLETEQYEEAIKDFNTCLTVQKELLEADNRLLAETYYQLGLGYSFNKQFSESIESYQTAIKVIESRIDNLTKTVLDKATEEEKKTSDFDSPVYKANKEVNELKEILPDMKLKIEDVEEERKNMEDLKKLAKEALGGLQSSSDKPTASEEAPKEAGPASDISHLIKRKRKSEDVPDEGVKKAKQENGEGDAPKAANGDHPAQEEKQTPMETKS